jgi:hypothetical protein
LPRVIFIECHIVCQTIRRQHASNVPNSFWQYCAPNKPGLGAICHSSPILRIMNSYGFHLTEKCRDSVKKWYSLLSRVRLDSQWWLFLRVDANSTRTILWTRCRFHYLNGKVSVEVDFSTVDSSCLITRDVTRSGYHNSSRLRTGWQWRDCQQLSILRDFIPNSAALRAQLCDANTATSSASFGSMSLAATSRAATLSLSSCDEPWMPRILSETFVQTVRLFSAFDSRGQFEVHDRLFLPRGFGRLYKLKFYDSETSFNDCIFVSAVTTKLYIIETLPLRSLFDRNSLHVHTAIPTTIQAQRSRNGPHWICTLTNIFCQRRESDSSRAGLHIWMNIFVWVHRDIFLMRDLSVVWEPREFAIWSGKDQTYPEWRCCPSLPCVLERSSDSWRFGRCPSSSKRMFDGTEWWDWSWIDCHRWSVCHLRKFSCKREP